ncbi:hypothetical protein CIPAW_11G153300 [Carya illinoinensis]|uniref:Uncharacterized protein n=1 Tax=Carya illinoinensis TaxID=32201 RepID=A0A8T1NXW8_CARIL|nr:hypothetical protein CIPAW_11G153300 [Carya illinoinensis]
MEFLKNPECTLLLSNDYMKVDLMPEFVEAV